ncbi:hypothetical protein ZOSMA_921G00010 [Zostera marina]|uniref:UBA domain-containing protein n=1 Tax=Zostera marina TaxID=29655 RepID=A0A0K9NL93_ZOSMR|nr:hypothetical protein ZOSMA_921G00010 [Zostera marina]
MSPITPPRTRYSERNDHISRVLTEKFTLISQKLIAMGFSIEELMALFENNWRLDNSIHWLLHRRRTMETTRRDLTHSSNIDISNDSKAIKELSRRFNCTMRDVERIVISYDGDLEKTEIFLMLNQQQHMRYEILSPTECLHQFRTRDLFNDQNPFQRSTFDMPRERCLYQSNDRNQFDHPSFDMTRETSLHQPDDRNPFEHPSTDINIQIQEEASRNVRCTMQHPKSTTNLVNELSPTDREWNPFKPSFFDTVRENWLKYLSNNQNQFQHSTFDMARERSLYQSNDQNQFDRPSFDITRETSLHQPNDRNQFERPSTNINIQIQEEASRNARYTMQHPKSTTNLVNELSPTNGEWNPFKPSLFDTVRENWLKYLSNNQNQFQHSTFDMARKRSLYQSNDQNQFDRPSFDMTQEKSLHQPNDRNQFERPSTNINIQIQEEASRNARYTMQHPKSTTNLSNEFSQIDGEWNPFKPSFFDTVRENWLKYLSNNQNQFQHSTFDMPRETSLHQPNDRNQFERPSTDINIQIQEEASRNARCTIQHPKSTTNLVNELCPTDEEWNPFKPSFFDTVRENWLKYLSNHQNPTNLVNELSPTNGEWNPFKPSFFDTVRENWLKYLSNNQNQFQHSTFDMPREKSLYQSNNQNQFGRPSFDMTRETSLHQPIDRNQFDRPSFDMTRETSLLQPNDRNPW